MLDHLAPLVGGNRRVQGRPSFSGACWLVVRADRGVAGAEFALEVRVALEVHESGVASMNSA
jgi:hypothetical protein